MTWQYGLAPRSFAADRAAAALGETDMTPADAFIPGCPERYELVLERGFVLVATDGAAENMALSAVRRTGYGVFFGPRNPFNF